MRSGGDIVMGIRQQSYSRLMLYKVYARCQLGMPYVVATCM